MWILLHQPLDTECAKLLSQADSGGNLNEHVTTYRSNPASQHSPMAWYGIHIYLALNMKHDNIERRCLRESKLYNTIAALRHTSFQVVERAWCFIWFWFHSLKNIERLHYSYIGWQEGRGLSFSEAVSVIFKSKFNWTSTSTVIE